MWSQPDIVRMNANAKASVRTLREKQRKPETNECEIDYGHRDEALDSTPHPAAYAHEYYDIFSEDPKGLVFVCEDADEQGMWRESFFDCDNCNRLFVTNYTWENYSTEYDDATVCIPCALKLYMADEDNWIDPKLVKKIDLEGADKPFFYHAEDQPDGEYTLNLSRVKHVMAVDMPIPKSLVFIDNFEFDSYNGHQISGRDFEVFEQAVDEGYDKVLVVLDAAYQFSVSIGVYVKRKGY